MLKSPVGTLTFLMTDIEGSTRMWEDNPEGMKQALVQHETIIKEVIEEFDGYLALEQGEGDSTFSVFKEATSALKAACEINTRLATARWPAGIVMRVRSGIHSGVADLRDRTYYGRAVNRAARIRSVAHGGQIILSRAVKELVDPKVFPNLVDHGNHRLKDLLQPVNLFEVPTSETFPHLNSLSSRTNNLPTFLTPFIGREADITKIAGLLETHRLVTLLGLGGAGKTRLALQVAAELSGRYEDGVHFVSLVAATTAEIASSEICRVLGIEQIDDLKNQKLLLLLDNCETSLPELSLLVKQLFTLSDGLTILATSRQRLKRAGEYCFQVQPLSLPPKTQESKLAAVQASEAVQLFVERAEAALSGFVLTEDNCRSVAQLCRQLEGLPLAIELAVPRLKILSLAELQTKLQHRFKVLRSKGEAEDSRHDTLRSVVQASFESLSPDELHAITALSVLRGEFSIECAEAILEQCDYDTVEVLESLADKSLLQSGESLDQGCVYFLETIREYSAEQLEASGQRHKYQRRLLDYALRLAERGPLAETDVPLSLEALAYCKSENLATEGVELCRALWGYWRSRGMLREGREWIAAFSSNPTLTPFLRGQAYAISGTLAFYQDDVEGAETDYLASLHAYQEGNCREKFAGAMCNVGLALTLQKRFEEAMPHIQMAVEILEIQGEHEQLAAALGNLGMCQLDLGLIDQAERSIYRAIQLRDEQPSTEADAIRRSSLSLCYALKGDLAGAAEQCLNCCSILQKTGCDLPALAQATRVAAFIATLQQDRVAAQIFFHAVSEIERRISAPTFSPNDSRWHEVRRFVNGPENGMIKRNEMTPEEVLASLSAFLYQTHPSKAHFI